MKFLIDFLCIFLIKNLTEKLIEIYDAEEKFNGKTGFHFLISIKFYTLLRWRLCHCKFYSKILLCYKRDLSDAFSLLLTI